MATNYHFLDETWLQSAISTGETVSHFVAEIWEDGRLSAYSGDTGFQNSVTPGSGGYDWFEAYPLGLVTTDFGDFHSGWDDAWVENTGYFGIIGTDDFEDYGDFLGLIDPSTNQISGYDIASGDGWSGEWIITTGSGITV